MEKGVKYNQEFYSEIYPSGRLKRFSINWWSVRFYALLAKRILGRKKAKIFDAGCGLPFILSRLEKMYETWGMDLSPYAIEKGKEISPSSRIFSADIEKGIPSEIPRNYFDLIIAKYIFEHLNNPEEAIHQCTQLLRNDGRMIISVPNMDSPGKRWKREDWFATKDETHLSLLSPDKWLALVRKNDLCIEKFFSDGFWDIPYIKIIPQWIQYFIFSIPCAIEVFFAWPFIPPKYGENIIIIARKT